MSWGLLFRHEINLTYRRIQDIHLKRNIIERWMGLATVAIQTASGSSSPEMTIEGILQAAELRDFLYTKMRGAKGLTTQGPATTASESGTGPESDQALALLIEIRDLLRRVVAGKSGQ
jgi:putative membrane protein